MYSFFCYTVSSIAAIYGGVIFCNSLMGVETDPVVTFGYVVLYQALGVIVALIIGSVLSLSSTKKASMQVGNKSISISTTKEEVQHPEEEKTEDDVDSVEISKVDTSVGKSIGTFQDKSIFDVVLVEFTNGHKLKYEFSHTMATGGKIDMSNIEPGSLIMHGMIVYTPEK
jgi:hypothetical protein